MNFEEYDSDEKIAALRSDLDQIMYHLDLRSEYVSRAEMAEREAEIISLRERQAQRDAALAELFE